MKTIRQAISLALVVALAGVFMTAQAQYQRPYRVNDRDIDQLLRRIENGADRFQNSLGRALDRSRIDNTRREDNINQLVSDFEQATNILRERFNNRTSTAADVQLVLRQGARIDRFMQRRQLANNAEQQWSTLRNDLNQLASYYNVAWNWNDPSNWDNTSQGYGGDYLLTGTYRLNRSQSDDVRAAAQRAVRGLPADQRDRAYNMLINRMEAAEMISIERRGQTISMASSRTPQATFEADGRDQTEDYGNNRRMRMTASLSGDQLVIRSMGNRATDFSVTFDPMDNGRRMRVTRSISSDRLTSPVVVQSIYDRVSETAQWNIYTGAPSSARPDYGRGRAGDYIITDGTVLVTRLNTNLETNRTREGERFTLTVISPSQYEGATIEGYVSNVDRGGRITGRSEMALNLEQIRMRNGRTYNFDGIIESVRTANGETVNVDNEGAVREDDSQTERTVKRSAIGAAIGAVIGAIAGGGSGAAIGAVVGAGGGAGSVYVQGRNDLELMSGSEITIRAAAPRSTAIR